MEHLFFQQRIMKSDDIALQELYNDREIAHAVKDTELIKCITRQIQNLRARIASKKKTKKRQEARYYHLF